MKHIWLDCDPGLDDTMAIIYAASHKSLRLIGVSTSPGNTTLHNTTRNALDVLFNIGRSDVPVFPGSNQLIFGEMKLAEHVHGKNGLGGVTIPTSPVPAQPTNRFDLIYSRIMQMQGKIVWANTGSLTNLCRLLSLFPQLADKLEQIVLMGGAIGVGNITPAAEFNIYFDPMAYKSVLELKKDVHLVMIPLELTHKNQATQEVFDSLLPYQHIPFGAAIYTMLSQYQKMYSKVNFAFPPIHDPCVPHYITHPEEFILKKAIIDVDVEKTSYGRTNCYFQHPTHPEDPIVSSSFVAVEMKNEKIKFWDMMLEILFRVFEKPVFQQSK